jgi:hypothetical protein
MDTLKIKTLDQVSDALDVVETARADQGLSPASKLALQTAAVRLRNLERTIIKMVQQELVDSLTADAEALLELTDQINESSDKLAGVAAAIEKAATVVESFIKIITSVAASGLL